MGQFMLHMIIGVASNLAGYLIYLMLTFCYVGTKFSMTIMDLLRALVSFIKNHQWAFAYKANFFGKN